MRSLRCISVVATSLIAISTFAWAQDESRTAEELRRAIKIWIGQTLQSPTNDHTIALDGPISVIPDGSRFQVTVPGGRLIVPAEGTVLFGETTIDLLPLDNGWYDANWRLPDVYRLEAEYGSDWLVSIGEQSGHGVFAPEYQSMMSMEVALGTIAVSEVDYDARIAIDRISHVSQSAAVSEGVYDRQSTSQIAGLLVMANSGRYRLALSDAEVVVDIDGRRLGAFAELTESMTTHLAGLRVEVRHGAASVRNDGHQFSMEAGTSTLTLDGFEQARSLIEIAGMLDGLRTDHPDIATLLPTESRIRLALTDLPNDEMARMGIDEILSTDGSYAFSWIFDTAIGLYEMLGTAGSPLKIGPIRLASDIASIDLEGEIRLAPVGTSPELVIGKVDMTTTGLDALIAELQRTHADRELIQILTLLQVQGAQAPAVDGRSVRTFAFEAGLDGRLMLNGTDIEPLIDSLQ